MKKIVFAVLFSCLTTLMYAQQKPTELDKSPMDISYWPKDYPILKMNGKSKDLPIARVLYGRPQKNGRDIFGGILKYNEVWRLGANETTEIEFFKNVKIAGKSVSKGKYSLFCIPQQNKWTIIINKDVFSWGSFNYDAKKDLLRTDVTLEKTADVTEALTIYFDDTKNGANLIIMWDDVKVSLPITQ